MLFLYVHGQPVTRDKIFPVLKHFVGGDSLVSASVPLRGADRRPIALGDIPDDSPDDDPERGEVRDHDRRRGLECRDRIDAAVIGAMRDEFVTVRPAEYAPEETSPFVVSAVCPHSPRFDKRKKFVRAEKRPYPLVEVREDVLFDP